MTSSGSRFPFLRLPSERHLWVRKPGSIDVNYKGVDGGTIEVISPGIAFRAALATESTICEDCEKVNFESIGGYYLRDVGPFSMRLCYDCVPDTDLWEWTPLARPPVTGGGGKKLRSASTSKPKQLPPLQLVDQELPDVEALSRSYSRSLGLYYERSDVKIYSSTSANTPTHGDEI